MARIFLSTTWIALALVAAAPGCDSKNESKGGPTSRGSAKPTVSAAAAPSASAPVAASASASAAPSASASDVVIIDAPPAASGAAPAATAIQNTADIGRYADEAKLDEPAQVKAQIGDVQNAADNSVDGIIASLPQGTAVRKIATHGDFYLVVYQDPSETEPRALEGWISKASMDQATPPAQPPATVTPPPAGCPAGTIEFASHSGVLCLQQCTSNQQCAAGLKCEGDGWRVQGGHARERGRDCAKGHADHRDDRRDERRDHRDDRRHF